MSTLASWPGHAVAGLLLRWYLAFVFLDACRHKLVHPASFALDVATYGVLPLPLVHAVALLLPWVELAAGVMLVLAVRARAGALLVVLMMLVFVAALLWALAQGLDIPCGCFAAPGLAEDPISGWTVLRDLAWLAAALYVLLLDRNPVGWDAWRARRGRSDA